MLPDASEPNSQIAIDSLESAYETTERVHHMPPGCHLNQLSLSVSFQRKAFVREEERRR